MTDTYVKDVKLWATVLDAAQVEADKPYHTHYTHYNHYTYYTDQAYHYT